MQDTKRIAIVTGASSGIGRDVAKLLAANGYKVALLSRSFDKLNQVKHEIELEGGFAMAIQCDLSKPAEITEAVSQVERELGTVSILINNAGYGGAFHGVEHVSLEEWDYIFAVNVRSAFLLSQAFLMQMKQNQFGRIINISSILGLTGGENSSVYIASKHALIGFTRAIAAEFGGHSITCNAVCPGYIDTQMIEKNPFTENLIQRIPMSRLGTSVEISKLVVFLVQQESHYLNGSIITADGGLISHLGV